MRRAGPVAELPGHLLLFGCNGSPTRAQPKGARTAGLSGVEDKGRDDRPFRIDLINGAVIETLREDTLDLEAFEKGAKERSRPFEAKQAPLTATTVFPPRDEPESSRSYS